MAQALPMMQPLYEASWCALAELMPAAGTELAPAG